MRLCPASKLALTACLVLAAAAPAWAQSQPQSPSQAYVSDTIQKQQAEAISQALAKTLRPPAKAAEPAAQQNTGPTFTPPSQTVLSQSQLDSLLTDPLSAQSKAAGLAAKRNYQKELERNLATDAGDDLREPPPLDLESMQEIGTSSGAVGGNLSYLNGADDKGGVQGGNALSMNADEDESGLTNLRRDAQREAALSFGARGGLAKRNYEIMVRLEAFSETMDKVFNFRALLVKAPSGLLIEPPIVREQDQALVVTENGNEAAVADRIYDINKQARIVTAPRDWRQYLIQTWVSRVPNPPALLWPENEAERVQWRRWVSDGWRAGTHQADEMFQANLARLVADFNGMIRYRTLLTQGMISQPYAMHEDRGVTGTKTVMRVGDRALRLTGPSQFLMGADLWKPADR